MPAPPFLGKSFMGTVPEAPFNHLHALWFQLTGTLCNLACSHCFISCSPTNHSLKFVAPETVYRYLDEAETHGVREVYFTGGEPFLHKQIIPILARSLRVAATSVLTNGTLITATVADQLAALAAESPYSLEMRVSLDDVDEKKNDAVRGKGSLRRALQALKLLQERGLLPIVAVTEYFYEGQTAVPQQPGGGSGFYKRFRDFLLENGVEKPRLKVIPVFAMGKLHSSEAGGAFVTPDMMRGFDVTTLQCTKSRIVAEDGVYACPLLVGEPKARLSEGSLADALQPCSLYHTACHTCYLTGMTCANY